MKVGSSGENDCENSFVICFTAPSSTSGYLGITFSLKRLTHAFGLCETWMWEGRMAGKVPDLWEEPEGRKSLLYGDILGSQLGFSHAWNFSFFLILVWVHCG